MTESRIVARHVLALCAVAASTCATAQARAPSAAASAAIEKAQQESDRTMYWIRVLAQTPPAKPAAPPTRPAAAPAPQARAAAAPEHVKAPAPAHVVASVAAPASAPSSTSVANATPAPAAPSRAASATPAGGADADGSTAGVAASLGAPTAASSPIEVPALEEEPDPGLAVVKSADPQFPPGEMLRLRKGQVEVKFEVSPEGIVDVVAVMKTTHPSLNDAALDAVRQWRFKPTARRHTALVDLAFDLDSSRTSTHRGRRLKPIEDGASADRGRQGVGASDPQIPG